MTNTKSKKIIYNILIVIIYVLLIEIIGIGIYGIIKRNLQSNGFKEVEAKVSGYKIANQENISNKNHEYYVKYEYIVENEVYFITTEYSTNTLPPQNSTKTIKYNPNDPSEAFFTDGGIYSLFIYSGVLCAICILVIIVSNKSKKTSKLKSRCYNLILGLFLIALALGIYYVCIKLNLGNTIDIKTIIILCWEALLGSMIFGAIGIYTVLVSLFGHNQKYVVLEVVKIKKERGKYKIFLENKEKIFFNKYYIYYTRNKEKFVESNNFKVDIYKYSITFKEEYLNSKKEFRARILQGFKDEDFELRQ